MNCASFYQRAEYKEWRGPAGIPNAITRPYAFSELVPADKIWIILAASARDFNPAGASALWLYAVPPPASDAAAGRFPVLQPSIFGPPIIGQFNTPPLVAGVLFSKGGIQSITKEMIADNQAQNGVNLLSGVAGRVILPPRWMLTVMQDVNPGGASNMMVTLSAMILQLPVCEEYAAKVAPIKRRPVIYGAAA